MGSTLVPRIAGKVPKTMQVSTATPAANSNTRQSVIIERWMELWLVFSDATSSRLSGCASATPQPHR